MKYSDKLKDPRWQKKRLEILKRDKWMCILCGDDKNTLHVHHWTYSPGMEPWDCPGENLSTLCASCHDLETAYRRAAEEYLLNIFRLNRIDAGQLSFFTYTLGESVSVSGNEFKRIFFAACNALKDKKIIADLIEHEKVHAKKYGI